MQQIEANRAWEVTTGSAEIVIAVLDTGVNTNHIDLAGRLLPGYDFLANQPGAVDDNDKGHGTFTAALAAGAGNNGAGMAGMCWRCRILPLKILNKEGRGPVSVFSQALRYAVDHDARVINASFGVLTRSQTMADAVAYATSKNVLIVAAAGNTPDDRPNFPAAFDHVLAVAASGPTDNVTVFSTFGPFVDIAAPGERIVSADNRGTASIKRATGTSAAAPLVSGAAGLVLSARPDLPAQVVSDLLMDTAVDIGEPGRDVHFGAGRLSTYDALLAAARPEPFGDATLRLRADAVATQLRVTSDNFAPGEALRVWSRGPDGRTTVMRGLAADARGALDWTLPLRCNTVPGAHQLTLVGNVTRRVATMPYAVTQAPISSCFQPVPATASSTDRLFFPETSHTLGGGFRTYWETYGGVTIFGFPISEEFDEVSATDGATYTVQYFERNRFEYHPEHKGTPYEVQLGLLGSILTSDRSLPAPRAAAPDSTVRYFTETRRSLSGVFLEYWLANGGLPVFGFPISDAFQENGRLVQYFERNRFEYHPELPPDYRVSLGLLGTDLAKRNGYLTG
jgi:hypothetical protein